MQDQTEPAALMPITQSPAMRQMAQMCEMLTGGPMQALCKTLADSDLVPTQFKGKPANCFLALSAGMPLGLSPLACLQSLAVINGRTTLFGDAPLAMVLSHPEYVRHREEWTGTLEGGDLACVYTVWRRRHGEDVETPGEFSLDDARRAGLADKAGPWKFYPKRMILARARTYALRNAFADALSGIQIEADLAEETILPATVLNVRNTDEEASPITESDGTGKPAKVAKDDGDEKPKRGRSTAAKAKAEPGKPAQKADAPAKGERKVFLVGDPQPASQGDYRYDDMAQEISILAESGSWVQPEDQKAAIEAAKKLCHHKLAVFAKETRFSLDDAMAWAQKQLGLETAPRSFADLALESQIKLLSGIGEAS